MLITTYRKARFWRFENYSRSLNFRLWGEFSLSGEHSSWQLGNIIVALCQLMSAHFRRASVRRNTRVSRGCCTVGFTSFAANPPRASLLCISCSETRKGACPSWHTYIFHREINSRDEAANSNDAEDGGKKKRVGGWLALCSLDDFDLTSRSSN